MKLSDAADTFSHKSCLHMSSSMALARPSKFKSQSHIRPGQSRGFEAKLGWNITSGMNELILDTGGQVLIEVILQVH
jgi:hypothetical protein